MFTDYVQSSMITAATKFVEVVKQWTEFARVLKMIAIK